VWSFWSDLEVRLDIVGGLPRGLYGVRLGGNQFRDSDQVVGDEVEQKSSGDASNAAVLGLAHCAMLFDWGNGSADNIRANGRHDPHQQAEDMTAPTIKRNAAK
jgi:hypothetical protein